MVVLDLNIFLSLWSLPIGSRRSAAAAPVDLSRSTRALVTRVTSAIDPVNWMCLKKHMDSEVRTLFRRHAVLFGDLMRLRPADPDAESQVRGGVRTFFVSRESLLQSLFFYRALAIKIATELKRQSRGQVAGVGNNKYQETKFKLSDKY